MVGFFKGLRVIFKIIVWASALFMSICACLYWGTGARLSAIPLAVFAVLAFIFVLKDHSEDWIRKKARDMASEGEKELLEHLIMIIVYLSALTLWILSVALSSYLKP